MPKSKIDKGPKHLSLEARRFFVRIRQEYELTSNASAILEVGLANWQMAREARALIRKEGIVMNGRRHPAIEIQKLGDAMFLRSMRELGLNISDPQDVGRPPEDLAGAAIPPELAQGRIELLVPRLRRVGLRKRTGHVDAVQAALGSLRGSERVLAFFRAFVRHSNGEYRGMPFEPLPFQCDIIRAIYDPQLPNGRRRVREALLMIPRKGGKTTLSAGFALHALYDGEQRGQVVIAANSRDQASLLFNTAADAVEQDPVLRARSIVSRSKKLITDRVSLTTLRALSAESGTAHGLDLTCWIYDELHAATNEELLDVLRTSVGARREPLGIVISTAGFDLESPLGHLYGLDGPTTPSHAIFFDRPERKSPT